MNHDYRERRTLRPDAQAFDKIVIETVPRYKMSELSGDEWRISARVSFYRKDCVVLTKTYGDVKAATAFLAGDYLRAIDDMHGRFVTEGMICDQEGCSKTATVKYYLKKRYCREGHESPASGEFRMFCDGHKQRGDCGLEDADSNYQTMEIA